MIEVNGWRLTPAEFGDAEYWTLYLYVPREVAQGNMRKIWSLFVSPAGYGGAGQPFANLPWLQRQGDGWLMGQSGGLDI